ncbi:hypothetical protein HOC80_04655 [archaeon]|jgi:hypothetical protein|nr:hypothetical protein [archaeon]MBT4417364.1 hypothetical protein [archaeon]
MTKHIAYLMQVGREGKPATYNNTPQNHNQKTHMNIYKVGVGIVAHETSLGIQLDGITERETRRVPAGKKLLEIFEQAQSKISHPTFKRVSQIARVEDITEDQYQRIQSLK